MSPVSPRIVDRLVIAIAAAKTEKQNTQKRKEDHGKKEKQKNTKQNGEEKQMKKQILKAEKCLRYPNGKSAQPIQGAKSNFWTLLISLQNFILQTL